MPQQPSNGWTPVSETAAPSGWTPVDEGKAATPTLQLSNPSTVPNARIRNLPNPAANETSDAGALYHGMKTGAQLASLPMTLGQPIVPVARGLIAGALGGWGAKKGAEILGAGDTGQEIAGDVGGAVAGGLAAGAPGTRVGKSVAAVAKPFTTTIEDLPVVGSVIKGAKAASNVRGELGEIWGKQFGKDAGASLPEAPPAEVTQASSLYLGTKPVQDPASGLGDIPVRGSIYGSMSKSVEQPSAPIQRGSLKQMMSDLESGVGKGLGASPPPNPKAPIYQRGGISQAMQEGAAPDMPEGHTPHQSSALRSSKYDPAANEFHARTTSGDTTYVYGDVSPDEAQAFSSADSKGKAFQQIKSGHPLVAKIINGKRVAIKPTGD